MNGDLFDEHTVQEKLNNGECILVINKKNSSPGWSDLRLIADANDPNKPLIGWAVCRFCQAAFRTHSKADNRGKRKNHGLTSCMKHLEHCRSRKEEMAAKATENSSIDSNATNLQPYVSQFLVNKKKMTPLWLNKLKEAEVKFIVGGNASTNYLHNYFFLFRYAFIHKC
jgi:hypothetical protein